MNVENIRIVVPSYLFVVSAIPSWIAQSVQRLATGWTIKGSEFESRWGQEFLLLHVVQTGSGAHPASYPVGDGGFSPGVKRPEHEADHLPPASVEVKKMWNLYNHFRICLHGVVLNKLRTGTTWLARLALLKLARV
jgi:hypothetical protein